MIETGGSVRVIGSQRAAIAQLTGSTSEAVLDQYVIPGGLVMPRDCVVVRALWSMPTNAGAKNLRVKIGPAGGALKNLWTTSRTSDKSADLEGRIYIGDAVTSQRIHPSMTANVATADMVTSTLDFAEGVAVAFAGQLASASDSIELVGWQILLMRYPR